VEKASSKLILLASSMKLDEPELEPELARLRAALTFASVLHWHGQELEPTAQAAFSHCSSHLGLGQVEGFLHFHSHLVSSHTGLQTGSGAVHLVWHWDGAHTVSHLGQSSFSHMFLGQRTLQTGFSQ